MATGEAALLDPEQLWAGRIAPSLNDYMGAPFEEICRSWIRRTSRIPFRPSRVGSWWDTDSRNEIDVAALGSEGDLLLGECKWGLVDDAALATLRTREALIRSELPKSFVVRRVHHVVFSGSGRWSAGVAREIEKGTLVGFTPDDLIGE